MNAWATDQNLKNVKMIPDGNGEFAQGMGMLCQKRDKCFGQRSWRYAMIVNDGNIEVMFVEPGKTDDTAEDPYHESSPESVMQYLKDFKG
jgi:peroxiredoxin